MTDVLEATTQSRIKELERHVVSYYDLSEQPKGSKYLIIDAGLQGTLMFVVDSVVADGERKQITAYDKEAWPVIQFSAGWPWYVINANYAEIITIEEMMRRRKQDRDETKEFEKILYKDDKDKEKEEEGVGSSFKPTGQYL